MGWFARGTVRGSLHAVAVFIVVSVVTFTFPVHAAPSQSEVKEVQRLILGLHDRDDKARSAAAEALAKHKFLDVKKALFDALRKEIDGAKPNSYVIRACIASLAAMVSPSDVKPLGQVASALDKLSHGWVPKTQRHIEEVMQQAALSRAQELPKLPIEAPKADDGFFETLQKLAAQNKVDPELIKILRGGTEKDISLDMAKLAADPRNPTIVGRKAEADAALRVWVRMKGRIPVLTGSAGVGKTAVAQAMALMIKRQDFPEWFMYQDEFPAGTVLLQTSAARIGRLALSNTDAAQAAALELYLDAVKAAQEAIGAPVAVFMDEWHTLTRGQCNALKPYAEELNGVRLLGATTTREFELLIGNDDAMRRRLEPVPVRELTVEETVEVLKEGWIRQIAERYRVTIPDEVLPILVKIAADVVPDRARPDGPIKFIQDLAIWTSRHAKENGDENPTLTEEAARRYAGSITGIPINPREPQQLLRYIEEGREKIKSRVIGQDPMVDTLVDTWMDVLTSDASRAWRSVAVIGTTGTGKSLSAQVLGETFLKSREKVLTIDCTAYQSGGHGLNSLLGAPNGIISSDETKGVLPEWLSGAGKQSGVIIFNEFDKAHPDLAKRLMEMIDRGELTAGDGHVYRLRRHLVVFTTNRGANKIFNEKLGMLLSSDELLRRVKNISESQARSFFTQSDGYAFLDEHRLPPEVVNRIDRWVVAKPIVFEDALRIASLKVKSVQKENHELHKLTIEVDPALIEAVTRVAFVASDGARPVEKRMEALINRARALAWSKLDVVTGAAIKLTIEKLNDGNSRVLIDDTNNGKRLAEMPFDEPTRFMALKDPRFLETLMTLEDNLKKEIFGQDEAMAQVAQAVRARANRPLDRTPLSIWLLGSTGTGKTESAKVLAKYLYGSPDRAQVISFGRVNHKYELNDIFSPPRGIVGSESKALFETILESFPEGTVIVFDELSNMGQGATPQEKESLFKSMYEIFGEGRWTNPHGKTYDLANYTFILTGNDGEKLFEHMANENLRETAWRRNSSRDAVKKLLRQSNIPEAFINRMDGLILMKPLAGDNKAQIVEKFLARIAKQLEEGHGVKIEFAPGFAERAARAFFPVGDGARGTERFVKTDVAAFLGDFIINHYKTIQKAGAGAVKLRVDLVLDFPDRAWAAEHPTEPRARLVVTSNLKNPASGQVASAEMPVSPTSAPRVVPRDVAESVAVHEAGHAVVNEQLGRPTGRLHHLTIEGSGDFGGYAQYDESSAQGLLNLESFLRRIAVLAAGSEAQRAFGASARDAGWRSDREQMNRIAWAAVIDLGLVEGLEFMPPDRDGRPDFGRLDGEARTRALRSMRLLVEGGIALAGTVLSDPGVKEQIRRTQELLFEKGSVSGEEFVQSLGAHRIAGEVGRRAAAELQQKMRGDCPRQIEEAGH